jgi:hypothetical protein
MTDILRIKRRALGGSAGAPVSLAVGELAFNEVDGGLYIGRSDANIVQVNAPGAGGIRYDISQSLTTPQQAVALQNIGAPQLNLINGKLVESNAANAATFAIKTLAGTDASASDPVGVIFSDASVLWITAALSLTLPSGFTMGTIDAWSFRLWFAVGNNAGTPQLVVRNCCSYTAANLHATSISGFDPRGSELANGIAAPGAALTSYSNIAFSGQMRVIGFADYDGGLATAGAWAASPTRIVLSSPSSPLPGSIVQNVAQSWNITSTANTGTVFAWSDIQLYFTPISPCDPVQLTINTDVINANADAAGSYVLLQLARTPWAGTPVTNLGGVTYGPYAASGYPGVASYVGQVTDYHHATTDYPLIYGVQWANSAAVTGGSYCPYDYAYAQAVELMG